MNICQESKMPKKEKKIPQSCTVMRYYPPQSLLLDWFYIFTILLDWALSEWMMQYLIIVNLMRYLTELQYLIVVEMVRYLTKI